MSMSVERLCLRCGYQWSQRLEEGKRPKQCPECMTRKWDKPAQYGKSVISVGSQKSPSVAVAK
jgi:predicted Zn-ribbon and HTH transcriptional regulator